MVVNLMGLDILKFVSLEVAGRDTTLEIWQIYGYTILIHQINKHTKKLLGTKDIIHRLTNQTSHWKIHDGVNIETVQIYRWQRQILDMDDKGKCNYNNIVHLQ
jgi:uncharacterized protein YmfQ (DUF2313 family)